MNLFLQCSNLCFVGFWKDWQGFRLLLLKSCNVCLITLLQFLILLEKGSSLIYNSSLVLTGKKTHLTVFWSFVMRQTRYRFISISVARRKGIVRRGNVMKEDCWMTAKIYFSSCFWRWMEKLQEWVRWKNCLRKYLLWSFLLIHFWVY